MLLIGVEHGYITSLLGSTDDSSEAGHESPSKRRRTSNSKDVFINTPMTLQNFSVVFQAAVDALIVDDISLSMPSYAHDIEKISNDRGHSVTSIYMLLSHQLCIDI